MEERIPHPQEQQHPTTAAVPAAEEEAPPMTQRQARPAGEETREGDDGSDGGESESESEFEFEFPFVTRDSPALAEELFADGRIRPFYPVFGRRAGGGTAARGDGKDDDDAPPPKPRTRGPLGRLFLEESSSSSDSSTERSTSTSTSSSSDDAAGIEGAPPESYCLWTPGAGAGAGSSASVPSQRPPSKSGSTGSMARWRRISELVVGRSHSDGKEKFIFFPTPPPPPKAAAVVTESSPKPKPAPAGGRKKTTEVDTVAAARRMAYGGAKANGFTGASAGAGAPRRTFLPYREELVGFFANVNGITRSHPHPF